MRWMTTQALCLNAVLGGGAGEEMSDVAHQVVSQPRKNCEKRIKVLFSF